MPDQPRDHSLLAPGAHIAAMMLLMALAPRPAAALETQWHFELPANSLFDLPAAPAAPDLPIDGAFASLIARELLPADDMPLLASFTDDQTAASPRFDHPQESRVDPPVDLFQPGRRWSVTAFAGINDDDRFVEIMTLRGGDFQSSYIAGAALNRRFGTTFDYLQWEGEVSGYHHWGLQDHWEMNLALVARWTWFPWDRYLDTTMAFGQGVSWASDRPPLERETRQLLNHLLAEVEVIPLRDRPVSLVVRAHHRSGVFGLYGASGGSNFVNLGVRFRF